MATVQAKVWLGSSGILNFRLSIVTDLSIGYFFAVGKYKTIAEITPPKLACHGVVLTPLEPPNPSLC